MKLSKVGNEHIVVEGLQLEVLMGIVLLKILFVVSLISFPSPCRFYFV